MGGRGLNCGTGVGFWLRGVLHGVGFGLGSECMRRVLAGAGSIPRPSIGVNGSEAEGVG
jgi:hypothetical protein